MATGVMRNGEEVEIVFSDYLENVLPENQQMRGGDLTIASGWLGFPAYWNHEGQYLDGSNSPHEFDLIKVDGRDAYECLYSRCITAEEIDDWLKA